MPDASHLGRQNGYGRKKGTPNRATADIKAMILAALSDVGGRDYLARQAIENPGPFLTLVGKVLPMQVAGDTANPLAIHFSWAPATPAVATDNTNVSTETKSQIIEAVAEQIAIAFDDSEG